MEIMQKHKYDIVRKKTFKSLLAEYKDATSAMAEFILLRMRQLYYEQIRQTELTSCITPQTFRTFSLSWCSRRLIWHSRYPTIPH